MLKENLIKVYQILRLDSYRRLFAAVKERAGSLSATEAFSADIIHLLGKPTLKEFADCIGISQPNATYKVNTLVDKGYLKKNTRESDRREIRLEMTDKFSKYFNGNSQVMTKALTKLKTQYSQEEIEQADEVLGTLLENLVSEEKEND